VIELTDAGYVALGDTEAVAAEEARAASRTAAPASEDEAIREADLLLAADVKRTVGQGAIREHLEIGRLCRTGEGKRGDPFRYWKPGDGEKVSAAYREEAPAENNSARDPDRDPDAEKVSAATQGVPAERNGHNAETSKKVSAGTQTLYAAERNSVFETAKRLGTLSDDELSAYRAELAAAMPDDPDAHHDRQALALFEATAAARATA
jgi:hypothetical protein